MSEVATPAFIARMERITSYAEALEILRNPDFGAGQFEEESLPFRGHTLLELDGSKHRGRRRLEVALMVKELVDAKERMVLGPMVENVLAEADSQRRPDGVVAVDLARVSHRMFLQLAASVIGLEVEDQRRTDLLESCMYRLNRAFDVKFSTGDHEAVIAEGLEAKREFAQSFVIPALEQRAELLAALDRGDLLESELPLDLLTLMLRHRNDDWDPDLITRESILYMAGATDTTSNAVNHSIAELDHWLADHPEDREHLGDDAFLRGVCNEALRLRLNVTALARRATKDLVLECSARKLANGTEVALDLIQANRDTTVFGADAASFNPWRPAPAQPALPYGLAFGAGRHMCIGRPLVTPISGKPTPPGDGERAIQIVVRSLVDARARLDPERPPTYAQTAEEVFAELPVLLMAR